MKTLVYITAILAITVSAVNAQPDVKFWKKASYLHIGGGTVTPGAYMSDINEGGLMAKNGYQIDFDYNYMFNYGIGIGGNIEYNNFKLNKDKFFEYSGADKMWVKGGYSSTKFGLNILANMPIVIVKEGFAVNFYGEFNAGIRSFSIPDIDLEYNPIFNKYVEVTYRSRGNTMGYLGYSAGLQFLFAERFGINVSYNAVLPSRHSIKYSVRKFDAFEELTEDENYLNNYLDHTGLQFGIMFIFGK